MTQTLAQNYSYLGPISREEKTKKRQIDGLALFLMIWRFCVQNDLPRIDRSPICSKNDLIKRCFQIDMILGVQFFHMLAQNLPAAELFGEADVAPAPQPDSLAQIAFLYERCIDKATGKREGIFLTPPTVVSRMVSETFLQTKLDFQNGQLPSILDPAVGSGLFLIETFKQLSKSTNFGCRRLISDCLYGIDKEALAVEATRLFLNLALLEAQCTKSPSTFEPIDLSKNIVLGNALLDDSNFDRSEVPLKTELGSRSWRQIFDPVFENGGFDIVIGNPPYGLSRGQQLSAVENQKLKDVYKDHRSGKVNKYILFIARGLELARKGGTISFIVPNAWLGISGGKALRRQLLISASLNAITRFRCKVFDQPSVEPVIVSLQREGQCEQIAIRTLSKLDLSHIGHTQYLPRSICLASADMTIPLSWSDSNQAVLETIRAASSPLQERSEIFEPKIAIQAYACGKGLPAQSEFDVENHIFDLQSYQDETSIKYLDGVDIVRFKYNWRNKYLKYGPWLAEPQQLNRFERPRVAVREILAPPPYRFISCAITETYLYNKSVLNILTNAALGHSVAEAYAWALSAILNSKLGSFWISNVGKKSQRRIFPKLVLADLKEFPLPHRFTDIAYELATLAKGSVANNKIEAIDNLVFELYKLTASHIAIIEASLSEWRNTLDISRPKQHHAPI